MSNCLYSIIGAFLLSKHYLLRLFLSPGSTGTNMISSLKSLSLFVFLLMGFFSTHSFALNPTDVFIENKSGPYFILDENSPCLSNPGAGYVAFQICNIKDETLTNLKAELGGFSNGFSLAGGQVALQNLDNLETGECEMVFWYVGYPCDENLSTNMTVTITDNEPGSAIISDQIGLKSAQEDGDGAKVDWMSVGNYFTPEGEITVDVDYEYKNVKKNKEIYFQPTVNLDFAAGCLQLTRFTVLDSEVTGIAEGNGETFHYVLPVKADGTNRVKVRYFFKVNCQNFDTDFEPYTTATSGNVNLEYNGNRATSSLQMPGDINLPCEFLPGPEFQLEQINGANLGNNWGMAWGDFNRDGYADLFVTTYDETQPNALYQNNGDGTFTPVTSGAIVTDLGPSVAATWGDYDNDDDLDLFVSNNIGYPNFLYRNDGGGNFVSILNDPIVTDKGYSHGASWADYDNDGFLDLFVATYFETSFNKLYHNNGDGTFSEATNNPVVNEASRSVSGVWADYDGDGWQDLFVANVDGFNNSLFRNLGGGNFERVNNSVISKDGGWSTGGSWADIDNDGDFDLFVANASEEANFLYENNGDGTFTKITSGEIVTDMEHSHGSAWGDYDNDGDSDLFVASDVEVNALYQNDGDGNFTRVFNELTQDPGASFGAAWADIDNDGDLDLFVANRNNEPNLLYRNTKWDCNNYTFINLVGTNSNQSAIGAKVTVSANVNGELVEQTKMVNTQSGGGTGGQNNMALHFGLGSADLINSIVVRWPSGYQQSLTNESINETYTVEEENSSEISGFVYYVEDISCGGQDGGTLPPDAQAASYRTISGGDWSSSSIWADGIVPPANLSNQTISIEHDVELDVNITMKNGSKLWVTNSSFTVESGNFHMTDAELYLQGAEFRLEDGNLSMGSTSSVFESNQSVVYLQGNFSTSGTLVMESSCFTMEGNFSSTLGQTDFINSIIRSKNNFSTSVADLHLENSKLLVENENVAINGTTVTGQDIVIWVPNGNFSSSGSIWLANISQYCVSGSISGMSGVITGLEVCNGISNFFDSNACNSMLVQGNNSSSSNNNGDENRIGIPNMRVVVNPGDVTVFTDQDGYYTAKVPVGVSEVSVQPGDNWEAMCPNQDGSLEVQVNSLGQTYANVDFGHEANCTLPDMEVELAVTAHRVGFENLMVINYENIGVNAGTGVQLLLSLDEAITPISATIPWSGMAPTILIWDLGSLEASENGAIYLTYLVDPGTPLGTPIDLSASLNCAENDCNASNDLFLLSGLAVGGLDPNDILVNPEGGIKLDEKLTYKIRFQNVGNAATANVRIENELPAGLDLSTLEVGVASHAYQFHREGNRLTWNFPSINLPDSLSNEPGSHGFVTYRIKPRPDLAVGEKFSNGAAIYFDRSEPVITNRVYNFILSEVQNENRPDALFVYPNPASGMVNAQFQRIDLIEDGTNLQTVEVFDPVGRLVTRKHQENGHRMQLDMGNYPPGLYSLRGTDDRGRRFIGKVILVD